MTCSQLSRTSSAGRDCNAATSDWVRVRPGCSLTPRVSATTRGTSLDEVMLVRSMSHAPDRPRSASCCAAARASRVLPIPPGPDQRDDRGLCQSAGDDVEVLITPDEASQPGRDVAGAVVLAAQRRMLPGAELENVLLGGVTIEPVDAEIR